MLSHRPTFSSVQMQSCVTATMLRRWSDSNAPSQAHACNADALQVFCSLITALLGELLDDDDEVTGVTYEHLFRVCRERLLVSSDETLKAHLTEYKDHDLLKRRRTHDGVELLYIPLPVTELQNLLDVLQGPSGYA